MSIPLYLAIKIFIKIYKIVKINYNYYIFCISILIDAHNMKLIYIYI